ncbi:MAG: preprotein translocase subunit YajC [Erysipelotrichaceae bacterium]|nr:preprotein translocase subunit YajC [Erysipelotrichaceae bacterium]
MDVQSFINSMLASAVVIVILIAIMALVMFINSKKKISKRKEEYVTLHQNLKPNVKVEFASGFIGKLVRVGEETCDVEIAPNTVVTISRYSISRILDK